jgi:hypothetical protein
MAGFSDPGAARGLKLEWTCSGSATHRFRQQ